MSTIIPLMNDPSCAFISIPATVPEPYYTALKETVAEWLDLFGDRMVSLVLFGSVARGDAKEYSDIDILIVAENLPRSQRERRAPFMEAWRRVRDLKNLPNVEWNMIVKNPREALFHSPLYLDMTVDGRILLDNGGFISRVLDEMRTRMEQLGSTRKRLPDGSWYWVLKPDFHFGEDIEI
jgi:predicted nucleotidyltransferase